MVYLTRSTIHLLEFYLLIRAINISISCQIYNAAIHQIRGFGSQHHKIVYGMISDVLGSQCIPKTIASDQVRKLCWSCILELPYIAYKAKALSPDICKDLQLEDIYQVGLDQITEENRNRRSKDLIAYRKQVKANMFVPATYTIQLSNLWPLLRNTAQLQIN